MRLVFAVACLLPAGCGAGSPTDTPEFELRLHGQLESGAESAQVGPLRMAVAWYPTMAASYASEGVLSTQDSSYEGAFPLEFSFASSGSPPAAALDDLASKGGTGHRAFGILLAYEDRNGNQVLDSISGSTAPIDRVVGISVADPSLPPPDTSHYIIYLDGDLGQTDPYNVLHLERGYNLIRIYSGYGAARVQVDNSISIAVTRSEALDIYACAEPAGGMGFFTTSCGIDPYGGTYRARGTIRSTAAVTSLQLSAFDGNGTVLASVDLDGSEIPYDHTLETYSATLRPAIAGGHAIRLTVPGHDTETLAFTLPDVVALVAPTQGEALRSGQPLALFWTATSGAAYYVAYAYYGSGQDLVLLASEVTTETSVTTVPIDRTGVVFVGVQAIAPEVVGAHGSFITPLSEASTFVTFGK